MTSGARGNNSRRASGEDAELGRRRPPEVLHDQTHTLDYQSKRREVLRVTIRNSAMKTANSLLSRIFPSLANSAARATKAKAPRATALRIEPLEARELLDAASIADATCPEYPAELICTATLDEHEVERIDLSEFEVGAGYAVANAASDAAVTFAPDVAELLTTSVDSEPTPAPELTVVAPAISGAATVNVWVGPATNGAWNVAGNWSLGHAPTESETIQFDKTVTIDAPQTLANGSLSVTGAGTTLTIRGLEKVESASVTVTDGAVLKAPSLSEMVSSSITLSNGASASLNAVTNLDNTNISVSGGAQLSFPKLESITHSRGGDITYTVDDEGSLLDLSHVTEFKRTYYYALSKMTVSQTYVLLRAF